jgi:hypothetical protein
MTHPSLDCYSELMGWNLGQLDRVSREEILKTTNGYIKTGSIYLRLYIWQLGKLDEIAKEIFSNGLWDSLEKSPARK